MAPTTRRRRQRQEPAEEHIPESIFDALNMHPLAPGNPKLAEEVRGKKASDGPSVEDLQRQLADMGRRQEELERANLALTTATPTVVVQPKEPVLTLDGLPDPVTQPKEYGVELGKRMGDHNKALHDYYQEKSKPQGPSADQLWEDFTATYTQYADDKEGVEFATSKVLKEAQRRGLDVNRYMYQNSPAFFRDITKAYDARFGKPGEDDEGDEGHTQRTRQPAQRQAVARDDDDLQDEGRTGGIFGGIDGSSAGRRQVAPPPGDMVKDLQDIQRKTGYYG